MGVKIPNKLRVGFQKREGTFTGQLSYVIYYDERGKICKEKSWKGWIDEKIPVKDDVGNEPQDGFMINKGIQRFNWGHFGSNRSMIRIYDPRGWEFEITPQNLTYILMHTDCCKRQIQGELVYAFDRGDLLLLPTASEEYQEAKDFTALQTKKVSARDLVEGATYKNKKNEVVVYLGRHDFIESKGYRDGLKDPKKYHIFCDEDGKRPLPVKSVASTICELVNEHPNDQFAGWLDNFLNSTLHQHVVGFELRPIEPDVIRNYCFEIDKFNRCKPFEVFEKRGNEYYKTQIKITTDKELADHNSNVDRLIKNRSNRWYNSWDQQQYEKTIEIGKLEENFIYRSGGHLVRKDGTVNNYSSSLYEGAHGYYGNMASRIKNKVVDFAAFGDLYLELNNGKKIKWREHVYAR